MNYKKLSKVIDDINENEDYQLDYTQVDKETSIPTEIQQESTSWDHPLRSFLQNFAELQLGVDENNILYLYDDSKHVEEQTFDDEDFWVARFYINTDGEVVTDVNGDQPFDVNQYIKLITKVFEDKINK